MTPVVVDAANPRDLVDGVVRALDAGRAVAVLDARWPAVRVEAARAQARQHAADLSPHDLVVFTSGTGGRPRAVHRTLASWQASAQALSTLLGLCSQDVTWLPGHPAATLSLYAAWHALQGASTVRFAGEDAADATIVHAVPSLVPGILAARAAGRQPRLRVLVTVGDRVPARLHGRCVELGLRLVAYYGAAELSFVAVAADETRGYRPFPGVELDIREGMLWSRSEYQALGYLGDPGARHGPLRRTPDGWACVGDRARWTGEGLVEILGRAGEAVTVAGHTVVVEEVEGVLREHDDVEDVLVVGLPDRVHGQRLVALWTGGALAPPAVGGRPDQDGPALRRPTEEAAIVAALPSPARPRRWINVARLPRTAAGKPDRVAARALASRLTSTGGPGDARPWPAEGARR